MNDNNFFDNVYKNADRNNLASIPWATLSANVHLVDFLKNSQDTHNKKALVIGCGLGDDAQILADYGYAVVAIDISETAIAIAKERFGHLMIDFKVEDIFKLPAYMNDHYDLVFESRTIQSLHPKFRDALVEIIANLLTTNGELLIHTNIQDDNAKYGGPPWPLYRRELDTFREHGFKVCYSNEKKMDKPGALYDRVVLFKKEG